MPLINEHITTAEWKAATDRAAKFLSTRNLKLGLVLAGYVLEAATADEGPRFLANVPFAKRILGAQLGPRMLNGYRKKLYTSAVSSPK